MIRIGVIGVGSMGKNHVRIYSEMEGVELVGISDVNKELVEELAYTFKTTPYTDYKKLLAQGLGCRQYCSAHQNACSGNIGRSGCRS